MHREAADDIDRVRQWLHDARQVAVLTGAGMSAESGIPTFRDAVDEARRHAVAGTQDGSPAKGASLWSRFDPEQLASEPGFRADPPLVWRWYAERRDGVRGAEPNAGHRALAAFAARRPGVLTLITQNVDDLHQRAGNVDTIRLHGDILADRWLQPCPQGRACDVAEAEPGTPPCCPRCGNLVRPGVVWFGEALPRRALEAAERAAESCDVMLVVGTSGVVWPAAGLAVSARHAGAQVVVVNPLPSELDEVAHLALSGTAARLLPALLR